MKTQRQIKRGIFDAFLLGNLARMAAAMFALLLVAGVALGQGVAPINPKHVEWQKRQEVNSETPSNGGTRRGARSTPDNEVSQFTFGYVPGLIDKSYLQALNVTTPYGLATSTLPSSYDQRALGHLTAVRDQGQYGTCWAHSTMGALETLLKVQGKGNSDFSEKHMANTHGWSGALKDGWTGVFGDGAWAETAMAYLVRWSGPIAEDDDPYPSDYYKDNGIPVPPSPENPMVLGHVQNFMGIVPMPQPDNFRLSDTYDIKNAVMQHGSVRASYTHIWGAMTRDRKNHYWDGGSDSIDANGGGGHSVLIVGWDDNYPKSNFKKTPPGNGAFIAKNSWGTSFGENGYFYISYYDCTFGRDELHAIPDLEPTNNFGDIYQYDPLGWVNNFGGNSMTMWGANVFTARKHDILDAIGFYATAPNTRYELSIYTGCSSSNPTSGNRAYSASGSVPFFGYVTVPLSQGVDIATGQRFSIVLKLTTPGNSYPLPIEYATAVSMDATASRGQSFFSDNGTSWTDFTTWNSTANFCCKAYTKSATAAKPKLASIAIISDTASLKPGDRIQLKCDATYDNNSKSNVTEAAQWSLTTGQNYATISSSGMLTGKNVAVPEPQTITVQAIYTEDGISATNKFGFSMAATPPEPPTDMTASQGTETSCVRVNWTTPAGATEYAVYRAVANSSKNAQYLDKVTVAKYNDTSATPGVDYWYFVKAKNSSGASDFSAGAHGWRALAAPTDVVASDGTSEEAVSVSWSSAAGASAYRVYRADSFDGEYEPKTGWISATEWVDTSVEPGDTYWYSVVAAVDSAGNRTSDLSVPDDGFRAVPVLPESLVIEGDASVSSGGNASYSAYVEYSDGHRGDTAVSPTWSVSAGSVSRTGAVTAPVVSANTEITLSAHTTVAGVAVSGTNTILVTATVPPAPTGVVATAPSPSQGVALSWNAVPGASCYIVYRTAEDGGEASFKTAVPSFTDATAIPGVLYTYAVAAENAAGTGARSAAVEVRIPLAAPTGVSATKDRTDCVRVAWAAVAGATHYRVARATSADGAKTELGSWAVALSYDDAAATAGTAYWYFVKAATGASGDNAGPWSAGVEGVRKPSRTLVSLSVSGPDRVPASGEAVYSCTANWSDGTAETVSPSWAASPSAAGGIDADGKFVASAVATDTTATITATYGGKTGTKDVKVVVPVAATATIASVTAAQRWPFSGLVDIDYTLETSPSGTRAAVSVSAYDADHNRALAATTLSGDGADGPVAAGSHRLTWDLAADHPGFHAADLRIDLSAVPASLSAPTGLTASQGTSAEAVSLVWSPAEGATGYEIWRGMSNASSSATKIGTSSTTSYSDTGAVPGTRYYYWVKATASFGTSDVSASANGFRKLSPPTNLSATVSTASIALSWTAAAGATSYEVWRNTSNATGSATKIASPTTTSYADTGAMRGTRYYYWVRAVCANSTSAFSAGVNGLRSVDLMPLRNLLHTIESIEPDGVLADDEINEAIFDTSFGDIDGNNSTNSADEMDVYTRIRDLNADKALISAVMAGTYLTYAGMTASILDELVAISDKIKVIENAATLVPRSVTASQGNGSSSARVVVSWTRPDTAETILRYEVYRATSTNGTPELVATVTTTSYADTDVSYRQPYWYSVKAVYASQTSGFSGQAKGYWGDWCLPDNLDLMPLKSLLRGLDGMNSDGIISDDEMAVAFNNPGIGGGIDGDPTSISTDELDILNRIDALRRLDNQRILNAFLKDDYAYSAITEAIMLEAQSLSDKIKLGEFVPKCVTASQGNGSSSARVVVSWTAPDTYYSWKPVEEYQVYRATTTTETPTLVATVTTTSWTDTDVAYRQPYWYSVKAVIASQASNFSAQAKGYWGDGCYDPGFDLMPLKSVLNGLDFLDIDGVISDKEMTMAFNNLGIGGAIDNDSTSISDAEIDVLLRIQEFNQDKTLIDNVLRDNYETIPFATMLELQRLSDDIRRLRNS